MSVVYPHPFENWTDIDAPCFRMTCGSVVQDDDLLGGLTARETLLFAARLSFCDVNQVVYQPWCLQ